MAIRIKARSEQYAGYERERYHRIQEEAGCHQKLRDFYQGYRIIKALANAEMVEV